MNTSPINPINPTDTEAEPAELKILEEILRPLANAYRQEDVEEIAVCAPHQMFCRMREPTPSGAFWVHRPDKRLTHEYLMDVLHVIANVYRKDFDPIKQPTLYATLRKADRLTAIAGANVLYDIARPEGGVAINIRGITETERNPEDFNLRPGEAQVRPQVTNPFRQINTRSARGPYEKIFEAAQMGSPIIVAGATGSGKTTLFNMLLKEVELHQRVVTVQDTPELEVRNPNRVHLIIPRNINPDDPFQARNAIDLLMRMTPDVIVVGEISTSNAAMALELMKSGHGHLWTSMHAGNPEEALLAFSERVLHTNPNADPEDVQNQLRQRATIIQMIRDDFGKRRVSDILEPTGTNPS